MSVRMLSVVPISLVFVVLVGCGGSSSESENIESNDYFNLRSGEACPEEKIRHIHQCFDSIHLSDENIGFVLKSKYEYLEVREKLSKDWTNELDYFSHFSGDLYSFGEDESHHSLINKGLAERKEQGEDYIYMISISTFFEFVDHINLIDHRLWFANGTIEIKGITYDLPLNKKDLEKNIGKKIEDYWHYIDNRRISANYSFISNEYANFIASVYGDRYDAKEIAGKLIAVEYTKKITASL